MLTVLAFCLVLCLAGCGGSGPRPPPRFTPQVENGRPSFLTRVQENCRQGQRWACDMLNSFSHALRERDDR